MRELLPIKNHYLILKKHDHQPLSRPPQAPPHPGNHSPRHRCELQRLHRPGFNQVCQFVQTDEDTSVLVNVTLGRQTVRKCGLSRPDGEKKDDFHISQMICILTNCVLACVSQELGDQGPKNKDAKDSIDISADKNFNLICFGLHRYLWRKNSQSNLFWVTRSPQESRPIEGGTSLQSARFNKTERTKFSFFSILKATDLNTIVGSP